ncbi:MAG: TadE family protein [Candidatus Limnocylindrales bacterium]
MRGFQRARRAEPGSRGQGLAEFALVVPFALMLIFGIISIGLWVFYQQQLTNAAREAARFAAIHSSTAICPTTSWRDPTAPPASYPIAPFHCDGADQGWPEMVSKARQSIWGTNPNSVHVNACWSGYVPSSVVVSNYASYAGPAFPIADHPPSESGAPNQFVQCKIGGRDPTTDVAGLGCADRLTTAADDPASDIAGNQVTAYACMQWAPPLAGFLLIPSSITMKAVITEVIHQQQ